jgi:hypothetical protein
LFNDTEFKPYHDKKFTIEEIVESIKTHKLALNPEYKPVDKKFLKVNLSQFLYNPYAKSIGKSFLIYWMQYDPMPMVLPKEDNYPLITEELIRLFDWSFLSIEDKNNVISGVAVFKEEFSKMTISPVFNRIMTDKKQAEILWIILIETFAFIKGKTFEPWYMVSPKFRKWVEKGLNESEYVI